MTLETLACRIRSLELQLTVLKASVERLGPQKGKRSFAELYGILKGVSETTEEELAAAEYQLKWDDTEE